MQVGRLEDSAADLRVAVELQPNKADAHNNLGLSLFELVPLAPCLWLCIAIYI